MRITAAGLTDVGLQRDHNEDTFRCLERYRLYLVADGMGGHNSGEIASAMAAEGMRTFFDATEKDDATWPFPVDPNLSIQENRLSASIKMANKQIFDRSCSDRSTQGMGTTIVGLLLCLAAAASPLWSTTRSCSSWLRLWSRDSWCSRSRPRSSRAPRPAG